MIELFRKALVGLSYACLGGALYGCPGPNPPTPPTPTPPPVNQVVAGEMLLTTRDAKIFKGQEQVHAFMAVQCCETPPASVGNSRWPLASESWMDYTKPYGANFYHFRLGPFYGDADHEGDWQDIGGAYAGGPRSDFNQAYWDKVKDLLQHAVNNNAWVEVNIVDTWYCKHAQWGDQQIPWTQEAIESCGRTGNAEVEAYIRKAVDELGRFGNVIWLLDNEGDQIEGQQESWYVWQRDIIRDQELKSGWPAHLIGANPSVGGVGDYVYTHSKQTLSAPLWGKWTLNNERNPSGTPEREAANFATAREQGLAWAFWRAGMSEQDMVETLQRFSEIAGGNNQVGCYPPDMASEEGWSIVQPLPACQMCGVVDQAKDKMGNPCGQDPVKSGEQFAAIVRGMGYCAGFYADQVSIQRPDGNWEEHHIIAWTDGCYTLTSRGYKNVWHYEGSSPTPPPPGPTPTPTNPPVDCSKTLCPPGKCCQPGVGCTDCPPVSQCPDPQPPKVGRFGLKPHNRWYDSTPQFYGKQAERWDGTISTSFCSDIEMPDRLWCPARSECPGFQCESRQACEAVGLNGPAPFFRCEVGEAEVNSRNAFQARCPGGGSWIEACAADGSTGCTRVDYVPVS